MRCRDVPKGAALLPSNGVDYTKKLANDIELRQLNAFLIALFEYPVRISHSNATYPTNGLWEPLQRTRVPDGLRYGQWAIGLFPAWF